MDPIFLYIPIVGVAGYLAVAGGKAWRKKKLLEQEHHLRVLQNLHAALWH